MQIEKKVVTVEKEMSDAEILSHLSAIEEMSVSNGFCYYECDAASELQYKGLVDCNPLMSRDDKIATKITIEGDRKLRNCEDVPRPLASVEVEKPLESAESVAIDKEVPSPLHGAHDSSVKVPRPRVKFPDISKLEVNDSYHFGDKSKYHSLSTSLSRKRKLFPDREFYCGKVGADDPRGEGFRIWRIA